MVHIHIPLLLAFLLLQVVDKQVLSGVDAFHLSPGKKYCHPASGASNQKSWTRLHSVVGKLINDASSDKDAVLNEGKLRKVHHLVFPGGGLFFYWQAGAITYLKEQGYDLGQMTASGASAGALTATLMATNVDFIKATELALQMADDAGIWDRSGGLQGIWGPIIYDWLDQLLPEDALDFVGDDRLSLLVTPVPSFGKNKVSNFESRRDLIECNMASVHLPWFLDGKLTANFRDAPHIDGSFLATAPDYMAPAAEKTSNIIRIDWGKDPAFQNGEYLDFIKVISPEAIWEIFEKGKEYAQIMEEKGRYKNLPKISK